MRKKDYTVPLIKTHTVTIPQLLAGSENGEIENEGNGTTKSQLDMNDEDYNGLFN